VNLTKVRKCHDKTPLYNLIYAKNKKKILSLEKTCEMILYSIRTFSWCEIHTVFGRLEIFAKLK
jgi:hypothetical protein